MGPWHDVQNQNDIDALLSAFGGFHDSCLVKADYQAGAHVDQRNAMGQGAPGDYQLRLLFHSQWARPLELCFTGVRSFHIVGWQERYFCDIFDCYLNIRTDLVPGRDDPVVVWADGNCFDPKNLTTQDILNEGGYSYVAAQGLRWRWYTEETEETP